MAPDSLPDGFDLFQEGIVDSLGVLDMVADVENHFDVTLDLESVDPERLTVLGTFCTDAARHAKPRSSASI